MPPSTIRRQAKALMVHSSVRRALHLVNQRFVTKMSQPLVTSHMALALLRYAYSCTAMGALHESSAHDCLQRTYAYFMPPQVLHCWSHGQGRWRGHHWQWPRPTLHQYQHLHPCSGCPRCSDAMTPTCRRRPSALAVDVVWDPHARYPRGLLRRRHSA